MTMATTMEDVFTPTASDRAIGQQLIRIEIEDGELDMTIEASFEGTELELVVDRLGQDLGLWHTQHSGKRLAMATVAALRVDGEDIPATALSPLKSLWTWKARPGQLFASSDALPLSAAMPGIRNRLRRPSRN